jgi:glycosyltransferase involved in cell wall biosynthesis
LVELINQIIVMKIVVSKKELEDNESINNKDGFVNLNSSTSVNQLKAHYFETLSNIGEIILFDNSFSKEALETLCLQPDVFLASFHEDPPEGLACRLMKHTKGGLMLTGGFMCGWSFRNSTMNIVTSERQAYQIKKSLGNASPNLGVFVPKMTQDIFRLPTDEEVIKARNQFKITQDCFHIVYAGRFIANKGIIQLVRALNLQPISNIRLTLVGDFEDNFFIYQSNTTHTTFRNYFDREVLQRNQNIEIVIIKSLPHESLRELFWSADCFAYPSFHEDENFGITPREAMLCGMPFVVTDFSGLGQLAYAKGGAIKTFPTLGGVRYSLHELRQSIESIRIWSKREKEENKLYNSAFVAKECNTHNSIQSLRDAAEILLKTNPDSAPKGGWRSKDRVDRWASVGPESIKQAIDMAKLPIPNDLYVDGTGDLGCGWFSEPHFLTAVQSIYTSFPETSKAVIEDRYIGFWRIAVWQEEMALVEFGYPGPRVKRFDKIDWEQLLGCMNFGINGEVEFCPKNKNEVKLIQTLIELGYLVPDKLPKN